MLGPSTGVVHKITIYNGTTVDIQKGEVIIKAAVAGAYYKPFHSETQDFGSGTDDFQAALYARRTGTSEADSAAILGVAAGPIPAGTFGEVVVYGVVDAFLETQATPIAAGATLVSSTTAGSLDDDTSVNVVAYALEAGDATSAGTRTLKKVFVNTYGLGGLLTA